MKGLICVRTYLAALVPEGDDELVMRAERTPKANFMLAFVDVQLSRAITSPRATSIRTEDGDLLWSRS